MQPLAAVYVNWSAVLVALVPPALITVTSTGPGASPSGDTAVIDESSFTVNSAADAPKLTPKA